MPAKKADKSEVDFGMGFHGSTSLGERGQVVIPKKLRDKLKFKKGDSLLVMEQHGAIVLASAEMMKLFANSFLKNIKNFK